MNRSMRKAVAAVLAAVVMTTSVMPQETVLAAVSDTEATEAVAEPEEVGVEPTDLMVMSEEAESESGEADEALSDAEAPVSEEADENSSVTGGAEQESEAAEEDATEEQGESPSETEQETLEEAATEEQEESPSETEQEATEEAAAEELVSEEVLVQEMEDSESLSAILNESEDAVASGVDGDCAWSISTDGVLTIESSTGNLAKMKDYNDYVYAPWRTYSDSITTIEIKDNIEKIGANAFRLLQKVQTITMEDSVTEIGESAFAWDYALKSVELSDSLTKISNEMFMECWKLEEITIPESVTSIGDYAFKNAGDFTSITIPESVTSIGDYAFKSAGDFTSITIPKSVTSIGEYAFYGCNSLKSVTIENAPASIGNYAFSDCVNLESIAMSESITSIGEGAFLNCYRIKSLTIPATVESIGDDAFVDCRALKNITVDAENQAFSSYDGCLYTKDMSELLRCPPNRHSAITFSNTAKLKKIGANAFNGLYYSGTMIIPSTVEEIGEKAFYNSYLSGIILSESLKRVGNQAFDDSYHSYLKEIWFLGDAPTMEDQVFYSGGTLTAYYPEDNKTWTSDVIEVYNNNNSTTSITWEAKSSAENKIASGVEGDCAWSISLDGVLAIESNTGEPVEIGDFDSSSAVRNKEAWFLYGKYIVTVEIKENIVRIGDYAFAGLGSLQTVKMTDDVTEVGEDIFSYDTALRRIDLSDSLTSIPDYTFVGCSSLEEIEIPETATSIGYGAFHSCTNLESITIPKSVSSIAVDAFVWCNNLKEIKVSEDNQTYCSYKNCVYSKDLTRLVITAETITELDIPVETQSIGALTGYCYDLEKITVASGNTVFCSYDDCLYTKDMSELLLCPPEKQTPITFSSTAELKKIGDGALSGCTYQGILRLPSTVETIGEKAFRFCNVKGIILPKTLKQVEWKALSTDYLEELWFLGDAPEMDDVFATYGEMTAYYPKDNATWTQDVIDAYDSNTLNLTINWTAMDMAGIEVASGTAGNCKWVLTADGVLTIESDTGEPVAMDDYGIFASVTYAPWHEYMDQITAVKIKDNVTTIGDSAFSECVALESITIPDTVTTIGDYAFATCWALTDLTIPESVTAIGEGAFSSCKSLKSVAIPEGVTSIGDKAFDSCTSLGEVSIPSTVTGLGSSLFGWCRALEKVTVAGENPVYCTYGNCVYSKDLSTLLIVPGAIAELKIPAETQEILAYTGDCIQLEKVTVASGNEKFGVYDDCLYTKDLSELLLCPAKKTELTWDETAVLKKIGDGALSGCSYLTKIEIPETVETIGESAFTACKGLTTIRFWGNMPEIGDWCFEKVKATGYYPSDNDTWTEDAIQQMMKKQNGEITWKPTGKQTGMTKLDGKWVYLEDGVINTEKTGLVPYDGAWFYVKNGEMDTSTTGFVDYDNGRFYVARGRIVKEANGLVQDGENWYFVSNGQLQKKYSGLALYDGEWFLLKNGVLDKQYRGFYEYDGAVFLVADGQIQSAYSGLYQDTDSGKWYFIADGQVSEYTGLVQYDGAWFYIVSGMLAENYSGFVWYDGSRFFVMNGMVAF